MRIYFRNIVRGKIYWVCDESARKGYEVFEYRFGLDEDPLDHWYWAVYETRAEAMAHKNLFVGAHLAGMNPVTMINP